MRTVNYEEVSQAAENTEFLVSEVTAKGAGETGATARCPVCHHVLVPRADARGARFLCQCPNHST